MELRAYQRAIVDKAKVILGKYNFVYLAMEVRTGKTLTSLSIAEEMGAQSVLFLTKKKALGSIGEDANKLCPSFEFFAINYESMHKLPDINWDFIILDEAHTLGTYPKPSKRAKAVRDLVRGGYAKIAQETAAGCCAPGVSCCGSAPPPSAPASRPSPPVRVAAKDWR